MVENTSPHGAADSDTAPCEFRDLRLSPTQWEGLLQLGVLAQMDRLADLRMVGDALTKLGVREAS